RESTVRRSAGAWRRGRCAPGTPHARTVYDRAWPGRGRSPLATAWNPSAERPSGRIRDGIVQPGACERPVTFDGRGGNLHDLRDLRRRQAAEELQFDDPAFAGIEGREAFECLVEVEKVDVLWGARRVDIAQGHSLRAPCPLGGV